MRPDGDLCSSREGHVLPLERGTHLPDPHPELHTLGNLATTVRMTGDLRVLGAVRLSRTTDESTSPARQRDRVEWWASGNGGQIVQTVEDLDVSGAVSPFERAGLGPWLTAAGAREWDVLVAWKLDRISRSAEDTYKLLKWCEEQGKRIVCVDDGIDSSTQMGRVWIQLAAIMAEVERTAIKERTLASRERLRQEGRWAGGAPVYGLRAEPRDDGPGYRIVRDSDAYPHARYMVNRCLAGDSLNSIAKQLNERHALTPQDLRRKQAGREVTGAKWGLTTVRSVLTVPVGHFWLHLFGGFWPHSADSRTADHQAVSWAFPPSKLSQVGPEPAGFSMPKWGRNSPSKTVLTSESLRGFMSYNGKPVAGTDGMPIKAGDSVVTLAEWKRLHARLVDARESRTRTTKAALLLDVAFCHCGAKLYRQKATKSGKEYRYYRCREAALATGQCRAGALQADTLELFAEERLMSEIGDLEVAEPVLVPGSDTSAAMEEAETALSELTLLAGQARSDTAKRQYREQMTALDARIAELEATPKTPDRWERVGTGETYAEAWQAGEEPERRQLLRDAGVKITLHNARPLEVDFYVDIDALKAVVPEWKA